MGKKAAVVANDGRRKMLAAVNIRWKQNRPDMRHDEEGLKQALRDFAAQVCGLGNVESLGDLNNRELGRLLDALKEPSELKQPGPGVIRGTFKGENARTLQRANVGEGEIVHLASEAQKATLQKLFEFLEWDQEKSANFVAKRFKSLSLAMLKFKQAQSLTRILLNIAVSKEIKRQLGASIKVSREMTRAGIPDIKRRLGIDQ